MLTERKSESLTAELDREFEDGSIQDKMYDPRDEKAIIMKSKKKHGLLSVKELEEEYKHTNTKKFDDYTRKKDMGLSAQSSTDHKDTVKHDSSDN